MRGYYFDVKISSKNHRHLSKCITNGSFEEPLLIESTTLLLLHLNSTLESDSSVPHTMQLNTIETNSFAIISLRDYSFDQASCIH